MLKRKKIEVTVTDGVDGVITLTDYLEMVTIVGTETLTGNWNLGTSGSAAEGMYVLMVYTAVVSLAGNHISLFGTQVPDEIANKNFTVVAVYNGASWDLFVNSNILESGGIPTVAINSTGAWVNADINPSAGIVYTKLNLTGEILNNDIAAAASIEFSKMEALTANKATVTNAAGKVIVSATTDMEISYSSGVTSAIQTQLDAKPDSGSIVDADINAGAAIDFAKMKSLTANKGVKTDVAGEIISTTATDIEIEYLSGLDANIMTKLAGKQPTTLTTGSMLRGVAGSASELHIGGDRKILIGDGTTANMKSVTGDISLSNTGVVAILSNKVNPSQLTEDNRTELISIGVTTEAGENGDYKIKVPFKCIVNNVRAQVVKAVGATDDATIILKNHAGTTMTTGSALTFTTGSAFGVAVDTSVTANNEIGSDEFLTVHTAKPTVNGGKYILSIEVERQD